MRSIVITAIIIGVFSLIASVVHAQNVQTRGPVSFATYDTDNNGIVTEQEYNIIREQRQTAVKASGRMGHGMANAPAFYTVDTNKDGQVSEQELQVIQEQQQANRGTGRGKK